MRAQWASASSSARRICWCSRLPVCSKRTALIELPYPRRVIPVTSHARPRALQYKATMTRTKACCSAALRVAAHSGIRAIGVDDRYRHDPGEADLAAVLLVFLVACRAEHLVEALLVDASLRRIRGAVVAFDGEGSDSLELVDPGWEGREPGGAGEACPVLLVRSRWGNPAILV